MLRKTLLLVAVLLCTVTLPVAAADYLQLSEDLKTAEGTVIMPVGDEFLIDIDDNLREGDIVTLVVPGTKALNEGIGAEDLAVGFLKVTRIKSGYSYVKLLRGKIRPRKGNKVIRYNKVPAQFISTSKAEADQIKTALDNFDWIEPGSSKQPLLTFTLVGNQLSVIDSESTLLYQYNVDNQGVTTTYTPPVAAPTSFTIEGTEGTTGILDSALKKLLGKDNAEQDKANQPATSASSSGMTLNTLAWSSPAIKGKASGIAISDLDGDGKTEVAIAQHNRLIIARLEAGDYHQLAELEAPSGLALLSIDAFDLDRNGTPELYLTASFGAFLKSYSVRYADGSYSIDRNSIPWYLRSVNIPGRGTVLLGQERGAAGADFSGKPFIVELNNGKLTAGETIELPLGVNLYGFSLLTDSKDNLLYAYLDGNDKLIISDDQGINLWQSEENFGGSLLMLDSSSMSDDSKAIPSFIQPRVYVDAAGEIVVPQNYGQRVSAYWRDFDRSRLVSLKWDNMQLSEQWSSPASAGYLADFAVADIDNDQVPEAVLLMQSTSGLIRKQTVTRIRSYELK